MTGQRVRLWIDTDVGTNVDDAVTLLCASARDDVDLVGISTVGEDSTRRASIARHLVADGVPVIAGDQGRGVLLPAFQDADPDALLAIGPLTNVAAFVAAGLAVSRFGLMGGTLRPVHHRGARRDVESNFGSDPGAAAEVLAGRSGILVVPLDATVNMQANPVVVKAMVDAAPVLAPMIDGWMAAQRDAGVADPAVVLHDPAALLALLGHPAVGTRRARLGVEPDGRLVEDPTGSEHEVVTDLDATALLAEIVDLVRAAATWRS